MTVSDTASRTVLALPADLAYLALALVLLLVARLVKDWTTPYRLEQQLAVADNPAVGVSVAGYYLSVAIALFGTFSTTGERLPLGLDLAYTGAYGLAAVILLNVSRLMVDRLLLAGFSVTKEIIEDRNVGTGAVQAGAYIASGLVVAGSVNGQGGGPHTLVAFYLLGQLTLLIAGRIYFLMCRYDVHGEIEKDNVAAGVALGLHLLAVGLVLFKAISGDWAGWGVMLVRFGLVTVIGLVLITALRFFVDVVIVPGHRLDKEVSEDRNINAAWVEGAVVTGMATLMVVIL